MAKTASKKTQSRASENASAIHHLVGCPAERIEEYEARRPQGQGGDTIQVARCIDCGASSVE